MIFIGTENELNFALFFAFLFLTFSHLSIIVSNTCMTSMLQKLMETWVECTFGQMDVVVNSSKKTNFIGQVCMNINNIAIIQTINSIKLTFCFLGDYAKEFELLLEHHYFESYHGKNTCGGEGAVIKTFVRNCELFKKAAPDSWYVFDIR